MEKLIYPLTNKLVIMDYSILNKIPIFARKKAIQINNPVDDKYFDFKETKKYGHHSCRKLYKKKKSVMFNKSLVKYL